MVCAAIMTICVCFYTPVGILGYATFGAETISDILNNYGCATTLASVAALHMAVILSVDVLFSRSTTKITNPHQLNHLKDSTDIQLARLAMAFTTSMSFPIMTCELRHRPVIANQKAHFYRNTELLVTLCRRLADISRLAIFDILGVKDITAVKPRMLHAGIQNALVPIVCITATKGGLDLGFFIGLLGCTACVIVQLLFPGFMAHRMGYRILGVFLVILAAFQFSLGLFLTIAGQYCKSETSSSFCIKIGSGAPANYDGSGSTAAIDFEF